MEWPFYQYSPVLYILILFFETGNFIWYIVAIPTIIPPLTIGLVTIFLSSDLLDYFSELISPYPWYQPVMLFLRVV